MPRTSQQVQYVEHPVHSYRSIVLEEYGVPSGVIRTTKAALTDARTALGEDADHVEFVKEIEKAAGVEIV